MSADNSKIEAIVNSNKDKTELLGTLMSMEGHLKALETFVSRRFDEISMEINATSQQLDMAEEGIGSRFAEIIETLAAISYSGSGDTQANTGVELEAVIEDTETAANTILDAADRIAVRVQENVDDWANENTRQKALDAIRNDVQEILLACTFQDLTGQRIRKTLENLHLIESRLSSTLKKVGIDVNPAEEIIAQKIQSESGVSQDDIDAMFSK